MSTCSDCKFFIPDSNEDSHQEMNPADPNDGIDEEDQSGDLGGTCHEDSPKAAQRGQMVEDGDNEVIWPWVATDDWCGRWKKV